MSNTDGIPYSHTDALERIFQLDQELTSLREQLKKKEDENRELKNKTIELCIAHLVSHFPKFGNKEFSVRGIREILDALKNLSA